jgi:hypothetical protein
MYPHPDLLQELARQHRLELIEDAAQSRRTPRGRHRRHALRLVGLGRSSQPEET